MKTRTLGIILDPDRGIADIYSFKGFHSRVGWKSEQAQSSYIGSFRYA